MEILKQIKQELPSKADVSEVYYEGSEVIIYVKNPEVLPDEKVKDIVRKFKKRIEVRPDTSILLDPDSAKNLINKLVPAEAKITDLSFIPEFNKVIIESERPGLVIGKLGTTLSEIKKQIKWVPEVVRTPIISSQIIKIIRQTLIEESKDRREFFKQLGLRIHQRRSEGTDWIRVCTLGGFKEVGRSAVLMQTPESNVLMDCGVNVASEGKGGYPHLNAPEFKIETLDAVIISHAHLDHAGFLPYLYKFGYTGPVYCTAPTRDLMTLLQLDYVEIAQREGKSIPYTKKHIKSVIKHCIPLQLGEVTDITPDTRLTLYNAGHILGSAITHLHIGAGMHNLVYTGDIKFGPSRLLETAHTDFMRAETMIIESTYGGVNDIQPPRRDAEQMIADIIKKTLENKGKVLVPVLGVGRAQEIMVLLDEIWKSGYLPDFKCYIDGMIWDATAICTAYPEFLSRRVRSQIFKEDYNPFLSEIFEHVPSHAERQNVIKNEVPGVVLATSGMLTGGPSVEYLRAFADNKKNSLIFVSYQAEGTLGKRIQKGWTKIPVTNHEGKLEEIHIDMNVFTVEGFSGHSDRRQLIAYVMNSKPRPERVIIGHGEGSKSVELANGLKRAGKIETISPQNLECIRLR